MAAEDAVRGRLWFRRSEATPTCSPRRAGMDLIMPSGSRGSRTAICAPAPSKRPRRGGEVMSILQVPGGDDGPPRGSETGD